MDPAERAGYAILPFVEEWLDTPVGKVPRVSTKLTMRDHWGTFGTRMGYARDNYRIAPGLYAVGEPDKESPVLVTANYKLTFDVIRKTLAGNLEERGVWVLVLETFGINVWCAAGKGTFSTEEIVRRVKAAQLRKLVSHKTLVVPQLGAPAVSAFGVRRGCGFNVKYGPVRADDLERYLAAEEADEGMRTVTFTLRERMAVTPVEIWGSRRWLLLAVAICFVLAGIGSDFFSFSRGLTQGAAAYGAVLVAMISGCVITPALLPWLPGQAFSMKGALIGGIAALLYSLALMPPLYDWAALLLGMTTVSSFFAMNYTGSTPFTSPSGVEAEMRRFIPWQIGLVAVAFIIRLVGQIVWGG